ncbi:hypothetical protein BVY01_02085 [bacterium I07]|nr:hypothetical protein BVY01_02085 [bacterium I07]
MGLMITDKSDNIIVTGSVVTFQSGQVSTTMKFSKEGEMIWEASYFDGSGDIYPSEIRVDDSDNVYLLLLDRSTYYDWDQEYLDEKTEYVLVKYNTLGVMKWSRKFSDFDEDIYWAQPSFVVDNMSNVIIAGTNQNNGHDYVTFKYDESGDELWTATYDGLGNSEARFGGLAVDPEGNIVVTGSKAGAYGSYYLLTVSYDTSGREIWNNIYKSLYWLNQKYRVGSVVYDDSSNVYVVAYEKEDEVRNTHSIIIKYNSSGEEQWIEQFDVYHSFKQMKLDRSGNLLLLFRKMTPPGFWSHSIIKIDNMGSSLWEYPIAWTEADAFALDNDSNLIIAGHKRHKLLFKKIDALGTEISNFEEIYPDLYNKVSGLSIDGQNRLNVFIKLNQFDDWDASSALFQYSIDNTSLWKEPIYSVYKYSREWLEDMVLDPFGNVIVSGYSEISKPDPEMVTVKYSSSGIEQWVIREHSRPDGMVQLVGLDADDGGNVFVFGGDSDEQLITIKYDPDGSTDWIRAFGSDDSGLDLNVYPKAIEVAGYGSAYVLANTWTDEYGEGIATIKYSSSGDLEWISYSSDSENYDYRATEIALDDSGNVYIIGSRNENMFTSKYNIHGEEKWSSQYNGPDSLRDKATDLVIDPLGNIFVTGISTTYERDFNYDIATIKYNSLGVEQWVSRFPGRRFGQSTISIGMVLDNVGNVYITGSEGDDREIFAISYNTSGEERWIARFLESAQNNYNGFRAAGVGIDRAGNISITGTVYQDYFLGADIFTLQFDSSGNELWSSYYDGPFNRSNDRASDIAVDPDGNVVVAGTSSGRGGSVYTVIKYAQNGTMVELYSVPKSLPTEFHLYQNYPNPFNPETRIDYSVPVSSEVKLEIFNVLGEKVVTLKDGKSVAGLHSALWSGLDDSGQGVSAGVYIARLQTDSFNQCIRMLLLK